MPSSGQSFLGLVRADSGGDPTSAGACPAPRRTGRVRGRGTSRWLRRSSASAVYWPAARNDKRVKSAKSRISSRARGIGADERRGGAEGIVDEVRVDLGAQGEHLGAVRTSAGGVEFGELELGGSVVGDLGEGADLARAGLPGGGDYEHFGAGVVGV